MNITYRQQEDGSWAYTLTIDGFSPLEQTRAPGTGAEMKTQAEAQACAEQQAADCGVTLAT